MKDPSRLPHAGGAPHGPEQNPNRDPSNRHALTVAPKGQAARQATDRDASQYSPDDSFGDAIDKAWQNSGPSLERFGNSWDPNRSIVNLRMLMEGIGQKRTPGVQATEAYADAVGDYVRDRYGSLGQARQTFTNDPVGVVGDGTALATLSLVRRFPWLAGVIGVPLAGNTINRAIDGYLQPPQQG